MKTKQNVYSGTGIALVFLIVLLIQCGPAGGTFETGKNSAGIVNPDKPLKGDWDLKAKKVWEISSVNGKPFASPMITVSDDEYTYIYDRKLSSNFIFDRNGKLKTSFGEKGQGPGEVANELFFFPVNGRLVIFGYPNRLHFFHKNGEFIKTEKINVRDMPYFFINEDEYISGPPPVIGDLKIKYINMKTGEKRVIKEIKYSLPVIRHQRNVIVALPGLTGLLKLGFDPKNKRIYYGINDQYHIKIADLKGNIINSFSVQRKSSKISSDMKKEAVLTNLKGLPEEVIEKSLKLLPDQITHFHKIQIEDGLVYVFLDNIGANWEYQKIDIFSLEGKYLYQTEFRPEPGITIYNSYLYSDIMFIKKDGLYLSLENNRGELSIAKYQISLPHIP